MTQEEAQVVYQCEKRPPFVLSQRVTCQRVSNGPCLFFLVLLLCVPAWAQQGTAVPAPAPAQQAPSDSLGRTTPRGTVLAFFNAARKGEDELAAQYLNTRLRGKRAAELAHQLFVVLDRRLPPILNELSNRPEGSLSNPLKPDQELVGTITSASGSVDILLERVDRGDSGNLWLFSRSTLDAIPDLYDEGDFASEDDLFVLPEFLMNTRFLGIALFQYLAVFVGMPVFYFLTGLLGRLLSPPVGGLRRRLSGKADLANPEILPPPVRLLLLAFLIRWTASKVSLPLFARQFWSGAASIIVIAAFVWLLILFTGYSEGRLNRRLRRRNLAGATSMVRLARRVIDMLIVFVGILVALYHFGVNLTAALAGLGVGGIAVALAAQKTLENVIAGVSLIFDQTVNAGDTVKVGDTMGTVEDIGLRSTRIRTLDRTVVSVPNGQIASMSLENLSSRDKFWFHPILALRYGTTSSEMETVLRGIRSLLKESRHLEPDSVRVRFLGFGTNSLDVEVFAYVFATSWNQFLQIQEELLLRTIECIESAGVQMASPPHTMIAVASAPDNARREQTYLNSP